MTDFYPPLRTPDFPFPLLSWIFDGYLNQDWDCWFATDLEGIDDFRNAFSDVARIDSQLLTELDGALAIPEVELRPLLKLLVGYPFGDDAHAWLEKIRAHVASQTTNQRAITAPPRSSGTPPDNDPDEQRR